MHMSRWGWRKVRRHKRERGGGGVYVCALGGGVGHGIGALKPSGYHGKPCSGVLNGFPDVQPSRSKRSSAHLFHSLIQA